MTEWYILAFFFCSWVQQTGQNTLTTWRGGAHESSDSWQSPLSAIESVPEPSDVEMAWQGEPCSTQCLNPALGPALSMRLSHQTQPWDHAKSMPPSTVCRACLEHSGSHMGGAWILWAERCVNKELDPEGTSSSWFMLGHIFNGHDECCFGSVDCVRALGSYLVMAGFPLSSCQDQCEDGCTLAANLSFLLGQNPKSYTTFMVCSEWCFRVSHLSQVVFG